MRERGETWVFGSDELYLLADEELPPPAHYGEFAQIENGIGSITRLRMSVANGLDELPRFDGRKIGVVTGTAMREMMPPLIEQLTRATGAEFDLMVMENSLFGPTTTASGLLVGADIRRALGERSDLDFALIPAETINENGIFLDDATLEAVRADVPIPMFLSYDFIDALTDDEVQEALAVAA